jgi:hypothetical protein
MTVDEPSKSFKVSNSNPPPKNILMRTLGFHRTLQQHFNEKTKVICVNKGLQTTCHKNHAVTSLKYAVFPV